MGALDYSKSGLEALMKQDEDIADALDAERFAVEEADRGAEVDAVIAAELA